MISFGAHVTHVKFSNEHLIPLIILLTAISFDDLKFLFLIDLNRKTVAGWF